MIRNDVKIEVHLPLATCTTKLKHSFLGSTIFPRDSLSDFSIMPAFKQKFNNVELIEENGLLSQIIEGQVEVKHQSPKCFKTSFSVH
jgi:hypothetical protein